jgi:hypothetical protein
MSFLEPLDSFDQARITRVRHRLAEHPLMTTESLMELAMRHHPPYVRFHDGDRAFGTTFGEILSVDPERKALRRALDNLGKSRVFVQINAICHDPIYGALLDEFLDEVVQLLPPSDRSLLNRDAAAFLASADSVTPFHLDHEQNFLLHIRGPKTLHVWDGQDRSIVSDRALEIFYAEGTLQEVRYREELQPRAQVFDLEPGDGVFMPMGSPHAVKTGAGLTATFSMLLNTKTSVHEMENYRANYLLRRFGFSPAPIGTSPGREMIKRRAYRALHLAKAAMRGQKPRSRARYI